MTERATVPPRKTVRSWARNLRALPDDQSGISMVEFGLSLPILIGLGMYAIELANLTVANMQVSQLAISVADNASRLGQTDNSAVAPTIAETDVDAVMSGALRQAENLKFKQFGKVVLSSLERHTNGRQYIHWQRCSGDITKASAYGNDSNNNGLTGLAWDGIGRPNEKFVASAGQAVMVVEVYYNYQPLFGSMFMSARQIGHLQGFLVRDDRTLGEGTVGLSGTKTSIC